MCSQKVILLAHATPEKNQHIGTSAKAVHQLTRWEDIDHNLTSFDLNIQHTKIVFHCLTDLFLR